MDRGETGGIVDLQSNAAPLKWRGCDLTNLAYTSQILVRKVYLTYIQNIVV